VTMTATEAAMLCRYVTACCPQQKFDEYSPDAWFDLLGDLPFDLCKIAAREVAKRQPFVAPAEIRTALAQHRRAIRSALRDAGQLPPDWSGEGSYHEWRTLRNREIERRVDSAIRSGVDISGVSIKPDPDDDGVYVPRSLIDSVVASLPQIEKA
jgi:hypothetical protein